MTLSSYIKMHPGQGMSYPIGLQIVNQYLGDIPNADENAVSFTSCDQWKLNIHSRYYQYIKDNDIEICRTIVRKNKDNQKCWNIDINGVPNQYNKRIHDLLLLEGLPRTKIWLLHVFTDIEIETGPYCGLRINREKWDIKWVWVNNRFEKESEVSINYKLHE